MIKEKRKARRNWQSTRELKTIFNKVNQKLKRLIYEIKNQGIAGYLRGLTAQKDTNFSLWKAFENV